MPRKKLPSGAVRNSKVYLRFTTGEFELLKTWFEQSPYRTIGEFCYTAIKDAKIITYQKTEIPGEIRTELKRIGNNINQIALVLHQQKSSPIGEESYRLLLQISGHIQRLVTQQYSQK
jgi:hypothetical protein